MKKASLERFLLLYFPWALASAVQFSPEISYLIAWLGSFLIFYLTLSGWVAPLPKDMSYGSQLMRPIFLVQVIFAGYMCCTSIFYFFNVLGYEDFQKISTNYLVDADKLATTAQCQRYYCLGHAAFVTGILLFMKYPVKQVYRVEGKKISNLLLIMAAITLPMSTFVYALPGLAQFGFQLSSLSIISATLALAFAIPLKKIWNTVFCSFLYLTNFYHAMTSGYKEPIIISVLILGIFLYPHYKKLVLIIFIPAMLILFAFLPTYNRIFRANAWSGDSENGEATQLALDATLNGDSPDAIDNSNWGFLAFRLSEIDMFTTYAKSTPDQIGFYHTDILKQSVISIIPRVFWPSKPITEFLVMERVYDAGVVHRGSSVSAKPAFIVDAYLSYGQFGVFIFLFLYGAVAQLISLKAEKLFGGYVLGTALVFSGLFQIMWRGISFEFMFNTVFWSFISMFIFQKIFLIAGVLKQI